MLCWSPNVNNVDAKAAIEIMRILYVLPGVKLRFAGVEASCKRSESRIGGANCVFEVFRSWVMKVGISVWYQSDVVRIISELNWEA